MSTGETDLSLTSAIATFATRPRRESESSRHADAVAIAIVDTVGVAIAGGRSDAVRILTDWVTTLPSVGDAPLWGSGVRVSAPDAALVNGTAAHALDWDDASPSMPIHPSAVLVPALLSQTSERDVSGSALVRAYNVGAAVFRAVSEALPVDTSVDLGWHNTATSGRIAAVAALANLTSADPATTAHALGSVASMASGSVGNFGTMTKPLHAGLAARDALTALSLAGRGFTANVTQLEHPHGFFAMYGRSDVTRLEQIPARLEYWQDNWTGDWSIKRYPCCYGTHHAVDAVLDIRHAFRPEDVERIDVSIYGPDLTILAKRKPATGLEAKFSLEYVVAVALLRGAVTAADFEDDAVLDPSVSTLMNRIRLVGDPAATARFADLTVTLRDGRAIDIRTEITRGDARNPMTGNEIREKFDGACRSAGLQDRAAHRVADALFSVTERSSVQPIVSLLGELHVCIASKAAHH